jgi:F-type H+-transporting ATPase subunit gamma
MAGQLRVLRRRIRSVESTKKITRAQELIATSRIVKAQQRLEGARPYAFKLLDALENVVTYTAQLDHPLLNEHEAPRRSALILVTSDRGFAGAYSANAIREGERLSERLREQGQEVLPFVVGRKGVGFYRFRSRQMAGEWTGISESPTYDNAADIGAAVLDAFLRDSGEGGVDEIHIVYTHFFTMVRQAARARRLLPLVVQDEPAGEVSPFYTPTRGVTERAHERPEGVQPLLSFEPSAEEVLDALLPKYLNVLIFALLLNSAASELAARRRAMKSATDNAEELIKTLSRQANAARQAEITQEISEIVGGVDALAAASAGSE